MFHSKLCKHEWRLWHGADAGSHALEKCENCGIFMSVSERVSMETLDILKGRQTLIAVIGVIVGIISAGSAVASAYFAAK